MAAVLYVRYVCCGRCFRRSSSSSSSFQLFILEACLVHCCYGKQEKIAFGSILDPRLFFFLSLSLSKVKACVMATVSFPSLEIELEFLVSSFAAQ